VSKTTVVNVHENLCDVYIGRPSKWGNPFKIGRDGNRQEVIEKYRKWIVKQPDLMAEIPRLRGKVLGCHCKPLACHGDVLAEMANATLSKTETERS